MWLSYTDFKSARHSWAWTPALLALFLANQDGTKKDLLKLKFICNPRHTHPKNASFPICTPCRRLFSKYFPSVSGSETLGTRFGSAVAGWATAGRYCQAATSAAERLGENFRPSPWHSHSPLSPLFLLIPAYLVWPPNPLSRARIEGTEKLCLNCKANCHVSHNP